MNSRERVLNSFRFEEPDQTPLFEAWIEKSIAVAIAGGDQFAAGGDVNDVGRRP